MRIEANILCCDEVLILEYAFRHYKTFCSKITLHDMGSRDGSLELAKREGIEIRHWDSGGKVDDRVNVRIKNECWRGTDADWVICADADEFIFFPLGHELTLQSYEEQKIPVIKTHGWEMFSETLPATKSQIYDEIKSGAKDDKWYSKNVLFTPKLVKSINFAVGAHACNEIVLKDGRKIPNPIIHPNPPAYLLHYHQIGSLQRIGDKYDRTRAKMCDNNVKMNWGNVHKSGLAHAQEKRDFILKNLQRVIA